MTDYQSTGLLIYFQTLMLVIWYTWLPNLPWWVVWFPCLSIMPMLLLLTALVQAANKHAEFEKYKQEMQKIIMGK